MVPSYKFDNITIDIFKKIKTHDEEWKNFFLPLKVNNELIGYLKPITKDVLIKSKKNTLVISKLSKWRKENAIWFDSFNVTDQGTLRWLKKSVINQSDRLLFLVQNLEKNHIGHMGLYRGEVDNFIRGQKSISKGIMTIGLQKMLEWSFHNLKIKKLFLRVFSDNRRAIKYYKNCGFISLDKIKLKKIINKDSIRYVPVTDDETPDRYFTLMCCENKNDKL